MNGVLIIDKPAGLTSHDVVNRVRRILHERSVGHLGTLDPSATGVLPLVIGSLTRLAQFYTASEKAYEGVIRFGFATDTYDADGEAVGVPQAVTPTLEQVRQVGRRLSRIRGADAAAVFGKKDSRGSRVQAGSEAEGSGPQARAGRDQRVRDSGCGWRLRQFPGAGGFRDLSAVRSPRYGPADGLRRPPAIVATHRGGGV